EQALATGSSHQLVCTHDGSALRLYVDGKEVDTHTFSLGRIDIEPGDVAVPASGNGSDQLSTTTAFDEIRIAGEGLEPANLDQAEEDAILHYDFEGRGRIIVDQTGNSHEAEAPLVPLGSDPLAEGQIAHMQVQALATVNGVDHRINLTRHPDRFGLILKSTDPAVVSWQGKDRFPGHDEGYAYIEAAFAGMSATRRIVVEGPPPIQ
ncbi:MAG: LamG-like jellyroll fold domain-containing protein, partial [Thiohalorhabdaceae bacterium]